MRSSKSRSRNKNNNNNRNRSNNNGGGGGNIVNRVFDSSGPEGKVRGTPQQIIDKYKQLTNDAQLGNDRVAAENFQQHAEHYTRMLAVAQNEMDARREQQERDHRERQIARNEQQLQRNEQQQPANQPEIVAPAPVEAPVATNDPAAMEQPDIIDASAGDSGLVETPEQSKPKRKPRARKPKVSPVEAVAEQPDTPEAVE